MNPTHAVYFPQASPQASRSGFLYQVPPSRNITFGGTQSCQESPVTRHSRVQDSWHTLRRGGRKLLQWFEIAVDKLRLGVSILSGLLAFLPMPASIRSHVESLFLFGEIKASSVHLIKDKNLQRRIAEHHFNMSRYRDVLQAAGLRYEPERDDIRINAWHIQAPPGKPTVVLHHGRRFNNSHQEGFLQALADCGLGVLVYDYPGFGKSEGIPTEQGLYNSGLATSAYAADELGIPFEKQIHLGNSLGSVVAASTAQYLNRLSHQPKALVLVNTFPSTKEAFSRQRDNIWPGLKHIFNANRIHLQLNTSEKLKELGTTPLLIIHGEKDRLTPVSVAKDMLQDSPQSSFKKFISLRQTGHSLTWNDYKPIAAQTVAFLAEVEASATPITPLNGATYSNIAR